MPQLSRFLIRSGMAWLVLGMIAAVLASLSPQMAVIRPTWIHFITVGWLTQLIFGVALWLFPRPRVDNSRPDVLPWVGFWCLNGGLLLRSVGEPIHAFAGRGGGLLIAAALLQLAALVALVVTLVPRIRAR